MRYLMILFGMILIFCGILGIKQGIIWVLSDQIITPWMKLKGAGSAFILVVGVSVIRSQLISLKREAG